MAKDLCTATRLLKLMMVCWQQPVITLSDIQTLCQLDTPISSETAYNYLSTLRSLGISFKKLSAKTWIIDQLPGFPGLQQSAMADLYNRLPNGHPVLDRLLGKPDSLPGALPAGWHNAMATRQLCHIVTPKRHIVGVPLSAETSSVRVWDVDYELPISLPAAIIAAFTPQNRFVPALSTARVIVQFDVLGSLMKRFEPTPDDTLLERTSVRLRVANRCDDATRLCHRLLRYQMQCRVIGPDRFKQLLLDELNWMQRGPNQTMPDDAPFG